MLSDDFISLLEESVGRERAGVICTALEGEPTVSVRVNPSRLSLDALRAHFAGAAGDAVQWAPDEGFYLNSRPAFTLDPLFHSGGYYVQEASSMYVGSLLDCTGGSGRRILDLCAAPGGKSTHILSHLGQDELLVSNEVISSRAGVLALNIAKWGRPNAVVSSCDPSAFGKLESFFDVILVDAPCSGEGMFRKDDGAVSDWSQDNVRLCAARQRRILSDVWPALRSGGTMIYSTCTFNHFEDEDNAEWICSELGAELISQRHFYPGFDRGEGLYCALLRKNGDERTATLRCEGNVKCVKDGSELILPGFSICARGDMLKAYPGNLIPVMRALESRLKVIHSGIAVGECKGRDLVPSPDLALSSIYRRGAFPEAELGKEDALKYLSGEPVLLKEKPVGYILLTFDGYPLGFVKNLGNRTNNLYPKSRRIRMRF